MPDSQEFRLIDLFRGIKNSQMQSMWQEESVRYNFGRQEQELAPTLNAVFIFRMDMMEKIARFLFRLRRKEKMTG